MGLPLAYSESLAAGHMTIRIYSLNKKKVVCGVFHIHLEIWIFKSLISPIERCSIIWQTNVTVPCPQHSPKCVTLIKLTLTGISSVYDMYHLNIIKISNKHLDFFVSIEDKCIIHVFKQYTINLVFRHRETFSKYIHLV